MSFKRKSRDRSVENTSGADDRALESEVEMLFELFCKYFEKTFDEHNKIMESKLYCDARQIEKSSSFPNQSEKSNSNSKDL